MAKRPARRSLFDALFQDFPSGYSILPLHGDPLPAPSKIRLDVAENAETYTVTAEIPGFAREDIDVTIDKNVLTIRAEVTQKETDCEDNQVIHSERYFGAIQRSISLPLEIAADKACAVYENGVLVLSLPKVAPNTAKKISIT